MGGSVGALRLIRRLCSTGLHLRMEGWEEGGRGGGRDAGGNLRRHTRRNKGKLKGGGQRVLGGFCPPVSSPRSSSLLLFSIPAAVTSVCKKNNTTHWKTSGGCEGVTFSGRWSRRNFAVGAVRSSFEVLSFVIISAPSGGRSKSSERGKGRSSAWR